MDNKNLKITKEKFLNIYYNYDKKRKYYKINNEKYTSNDEIEELSMIIYKSYKSNSYYDDSLFVNMNQEQISFFNYNINKIININVWLRDNTPSNIMDYLNNNSELYNTFKVNSFFDSNIHSKFWDYFKKIVDIILEADNIIIYKNNGVEYRINIEDKEFQNYIFSLKNEIFQLKKDVNKSKDEIANLSKIQNNVEAKLKQIQNDKMDKSEQKKMLIQILDEVLNIVPFGKAAKAIFLITSEAAKQLSWTHKIETE